jgi:hypothetical protein
MKKKLLFIIAAVLLNINLFSQPVTNQRLPITVKDAWIRPAAANANTALFFEVVNNGYLPDTLLSVKFNLAEIVELHETYKKENDMMGMREVQKVAIPARGSVIFKPRGLHVMLIGTLKDLRLGDKHEVTLLFKSAGKIKMKALVRDMPSMK